MKTTRKGRARISTCALVAGMPTGPSAPERAQRVVDPVCANFRKKRNFLPPLLGNHLALHFFLEGEGALS